jgi:hypothetical protein
MPSLLSYHSYLRRYESCKIVDHAAEAGGNIRAFPMEALFFAHGAIFATDETSPTRFSFSKKDPQNGVLVEQRAVLQNCSFRQINKVRAGSTWSVKANA